jgi:16S rRNA (adenine1518-N6/adenine1519-N6)-dimethyltransferase
MLKSRGGSRIRVIRKRFGQHFLEPAWVEKVIRAIAPQPDERFVEIGPGRGALTQPLVARAQSVDAFEIDRDLAGDLRAKAPPNLTVIEGDFMESGWVLRDRSQGPLRVAANLPYNVASPILFRLIELYSLGVEFIDATVMLQREVADRMVAAPGTRDYGVLSILIRHAAQVELLLKLPPGAFRPPPKVSSALVRLRFHQLDPPVKDPVVFAAIVQAVFTRRRKTLANALLAYRGAVGLQPVDALARSGLDGRRRPETLSIEEFARLSDVYVGSDGGQTPV